MSKTKNTATQAPKSYAHAMQELQQLVSDIESENTDVDSLAEKVARASFLIKHCQNKLRNIQTEVNTTLEQL